MKVQIKHQINMPWKAATVNVCYSVRTNEHEYETQENYEINIS